MATAVAPQNSNGQKSGVSTSTPETLKTPSNGRTSYSDAEKEGALAPLKENEEIVGRSVTIYTTYLTEGVGTAERKKEYTNHTFMDEARVAAYRADSGGKNAKIERRRVIKMNDGRYINGECLPIRMGIDKQLIAKVRQDALSSLAEEQQISILKFDADGNYITTSES